MPSRLDRLPDAEPRSRSHPKRQSWHLSSPDLIRPQSNMVYKAQDVHRPRSGRPSVVATLGEYNKGPCDPVASLPQLIVYTRDQGLSRSRIPVRHRHPGIDGGGNNARPMPERPSSWGIVNSYCRTIYNDQHEDTDSSKPPLSLKGTLAQAYPCLDHSKCDTTGRFQPLIYVGDVLSSHVFEPGEIE